MRDHHLDLFMSKFKGFRLRKSKHHPPEECVPTAAARETNAGLPAPHADSNAQARVMQKVKEMGASFFALPADQYGAWIDALPREEFIEYVALCLNIPAPAN